jgi:acetate kinase
VFAGGIGERGTELRQMIADKVQCLGYESLDKELNANVAKSSEDVVLISTCGTHVEVDGETRKKRILVCHTDEQVRALLSLSVKIVSSSYICTV